MGCSRLRGKHREGDKEEETGGVREIEFNNANFKVTKRRSNFSCDCMWLVSFSSFHFHFQLSLCLFLFLVVVVIVPVVVILVTYEGKGYYKWVANRNAFNT